MVNCELQGNLQGNYELLLLPLPLPLLLLLHWSVRSFQVSNTKTIKETICAAWKERQLAFFIFNWQSPLAYP